MLSIFFPMWNEEPYIERAVDAARQVCEVMVADGEIGDYELIDRRRRVDRSHARDRRRAGGRRPPRAGRAPRAQPQARRLDQDRLRHRHAATSSCTPTPTCRSTCTSSRAPCACSATYDVDIVSAYRFDRTGEGYLRAVYTFFYNLLIRWMFGVKARDINFAFKLCRKRIFDSVHLAAKARSSTPS